MKLDTLLRALKDYSISGLKDISVSGITEDSRVVKKGFIFVAIKGLTLDGHDFIEEAIKKGASVIVGEKEVTLAKTYIKVKDSREALGVLAAAFYENPSEKMKVIGVTGTDGKTTTSNLIYWILKSSGKKVGLVSTIGAKIGEKLIDTGFHVTNPDPVNLEKLLSEMFKSGSEYAVLEVTSHGLDQKRIAGVKFDAGVLTNITHEHLDYHKTFEEYVKAKAKLFDGVRIAVLNKKDSSYPKIKSLIKRGVKIVDFPQEFSSQVREAIEKRFEEDYNRENAQAAAALVQEYGVGDEEISKAIETFPDLPGRMEEIKNGKGIKIIVDFAHTPNALEKALQALRKRKEGRLISVFGCAGERDKGKRPLMGEISAKLSDISILTAEDPRNEDLDTIIKEILAGALKAGAVEGENLYIEKERGEAIKLAIELAKKGDIVAIFGKGHEKSMALKGKEYPWSDQEAVVAALKGRKTKIEKDFSFKNLKKVHFTGIKGVGMASLALCLDDMGVKVSGSDTEELFVTDEILEKRNISWKVGFSEKNLDSETDLVIVTGAHGGLTNPEVIAAREMRIAVMTHAEALAKVASGKKTIAVCGVGGKTTVSSMLAVVLTKGGKFPSYAVGVGNIFPLNTPGKYETGGEYFICEADEFAVSPGVDARPRFSFLSPTILVVTNIEHDHPDIYPTIEDTKRTFRKFFEKVPQDGVLVACQDNENVREVIKGLGVPIITYGFNPGADWQITDLTFEKGRTKFSLLGEGVSIKDIVLNVPGKYNVLNAVATFIVAKKAGLSDIEAVRGLAEFKGSRRRFEFIGEAGGVTIYDDYAHHPKEIKAVLEAARNWFKDKRIVALFQPHTYSRTKALFKEFAASFKEADVTGLMDIYSSAREVPDPSVSSQKLALEAKKENKNVFYTGSHENTLKWLKGTLKRGDVLITLGAGDIFHLHKKILNG